jgi:S1-C subfamily serine protease
LSFDDSEDQLTISEVQRGSLASRIGLEDGDEILSVNGRRVSSEREFFRWISQAQPGRRIPVEVWRDGDRHTVYWTGALQQGSQQYGSSTAQYNQEGHAFLGVQLDQRFPNAAVVRQVYRNSPAEHAGLRPGDWIVSVNGQRVSSSQDLTNEVSQLEPGAAVQIQISRPTTQNMQVRLGDRGDANQASYEEDSRSYQTGSRNQYDESRSSRRSSGQSSNRGSGRYSDDRSGYQSGEDTGSADEDSDYDSSRDTSSSEAYDDASGSAEQD